LNASNVQEKKEIIENGFCYVLLFNKELHPLLTLILGSFPLLTNVLELMNKIKNNSKIKLKIIYSNGIVHLSLDNHGTYLTSTDFQYLGNNTYIGGFRQEKL